MRKLTGYIGAMIIVFALMGSILAGFALNINGQSTVINNYESITDVSGLYNHTQEKTYIEYSPADNYIGYSTNYTNDHLSNVYAKKLTGNHTIIVSNQFMSVDGTTQPGTTGNTIFLTDNTLITAPTGVNYCAIFHKQDAPTVYAFTFTITLTGSSMVISGTDANTNLPFTISDTNRFAMVYYSTSGSDYYVVYASSNTIPAFYSDNLPIISYGNSVGYGWITTSNSSVYDFSSNNYQLLNLFYPTTVNTDTYKTANANYTALGIGLTCNTLYIPKEIPITGYGIDYTPSNRVNNYPMLINPADITTTNATIDLMNITATSYWPSNTYYVSIFEKVGQGGPNMIDYVRSPSHENEGIHNYKLSDVLANYSIPANTKTIQINANGTSYTTKNMTHANYSVNFDDNIVGFTNLDSYVDSTELYVNGVYGQKDTLIYDLDRGIVDVYDYNGIKKYSNTPDKIMVCFTDTGYNDARGVYYVDLGGGYITQQLADFDFPSNRARPYINLLCTSITAEQIDYVDITKGVRVYPGSNNVIWDNGYENGDIQLLFRADNTQQTYSNEITVSNNTINIEYTNSRFYVTLNSGSPVDIGTWRNIILDIDLEHQKLYAVPVRTFNSYTSVITDNTNIVIGDMPGATPTNTIIWKPTNNPLMFNVYSTKVFMDTYGVVMVNPSLNITNYFTDLNDFYRLKLYNFSIYGDSITVNGVTGTVTGNNLTIGEDTLTIKDLAITYADGHAYIADSNITIDLGAIANNDVSLNGVWYFQTELLRGLTDTKLVYDWDWSQFILDNTQFCIFYMGLALVGVIIARHFCILSITDYAVLVVSFIIALGVQVIA